MFAGKFVHFEAVLDFFLFRAVLVGSCSCFEMFRVGEDVISVIR